MSPFQVGPRAGILLLLGVLSMIAGQALAGGACGDTVSAALCMATDSVWGPYGVLPFSAQETNWAVQFVLRSVPSGLPALPAIVPFGSLIMLSQGGLL